MDVQVSVRGKLFTTNTVFFPVRWKLRNIIGNAHFYWIIIYAGANTNADLFYLLIENIVLV